MRWSAIGPSAGCAPRPPQILPDWGRPGTDYVLIARAATDRRPFAALLADLEAALRRVGASATARAPREPRRAVRRDEMRPQHPARIADAALRGAIRGYQLLVSPLLAPCCRFLPSCSDYAIEAVERHGALRGGGLALWRLARCHPWGGSGYDPVPAPRSPRARSPRPRSPRIGQTRPRPPSRRAPSRQRRLRAPVPTRMEQRNLLIAIVLSVGILIGFQFVFERLHPTVPHLATQATAPANPAASGTTAGAPTTGAPATGAPATSAPATSAPGAVAAKAAETREAAIAGQPRVRIQTPRLHGSIALTGARFDDLTLATYHETVDPKSPEVVLLSPPGTAQSLPRRIRLGRGRAGDGQGARAADPMDSLGRPADPGQPGDPDLGQWRGARLHPHRFRSIDDYMFTVHDEVRNTGAAVVELMPYGLVSRTGTPQVAGYYILFEGLIGYLDGSLQEVKYASLSPDKPLDYSSTGGWLGFTDKYWLTSLIPPQSEPVKARFTRTLESGVDRYQTDYLGSKITVAPDAVATVSTRFFAGAKEVDLLDAYAASGIPRFDRAIDFGWFYFLTKPMFLTLQFFDRLLGNFGLAILLLTLCVKLLFFPLANKSYKAMSKMKLLQPEIQKLRERFPDDKPRQQQEMMALYKRVGANPLAGCLPIVIQIPVFFSLYKVLFVTLEMRHAPFFGWIHDLSAPDPTSFANLFGLLPFTPPSMLMIGAWPLIMGLTMFLQQKLNPQPVDPMQARMFMILPMVFTYMLSHFPAGLVIYWAWNNLSASASNG